MAYKLDEVDLQLLKILQSNAKLTTKELAEKVNLTPTPVFERQKRLERLGYIKKYVAVLDPEKLGQELLVFCKVKLLHINHEIANKFTRHILRYVGQLRLPSAHTNPQHEAISGVRAYKTGRDRGRKLHREHLRDE